MIATESQNRRLVYARVNTYTYGQTLDAKLSRLEAAKCVLIFRKKVTGVRADRRELLAHRARRPAGAF